MQARSLKTRRGVIHFPTYIPVTTFGKKYPLDDLIRPYLPRLASAVMVSHYYAKQMAPAQMPSIPIWVDSGGFAALFNGTRLIEKDGLGILEIPEDEGFDTLHPQKVLEFQSEIADVAFTLDFPISPNLELKEAEKRQKLTVANALWAVKNRRRRDLPLYACVQAWDVSSARECAKAYVNQGFDGIAIGGLVPRARDAELVLAIVEAVRSEIGDLPLHVFGLGKPEMVQTLYKAGVDSVDSSSYIQYAVDGKLWSDSAFQMNDPTITDRLHLALCNLAAATSKTLPLGMSNVVFSTLSLGK